jgi:hypothetical protein
MIMIRPQILFNIKKLINTICNQSKSPTSTNISVYIYIICVPKNSAYYLPTFQKLRTPCHKIDILHSSQHKICFRPQLLTKIIWPEPNEINDYYHGSESIL